MMSVQPLLASPFGQPPTLPRTRVSDNGGGIAPEHLPQVFDRFFRTDSARGRETGGARLGPAIVKAIVEPHSGAVRAESAGIGRGSTFVVTLPPSG